jgi:hypothetical protein
MGVDQSGHEDGAAEVDDFFAGFWEQVWPYSGDGIAPHAHRTGERGGVVHGEDSVSADEHREKTEAGPVRFNGKPAGVFGDAAPGVGDGCLGEDD